MSVLGKKQEIFSRLSNEHETWMLAQPGIEIRGGEWLRTKSQAEWNSLHCRVCKKHRDKALHNRASSYFKHAFRAIGIKRSNHILKLAKDHNVFRNGIWLKKSEDLRWSGERWESRSGTYRGIKIVCCWGGRFRKPDGNHVSFLHQGVK